MAARNHRHPLLRATLGAALVAGGLSACAPRETGGVYSAAAIGRTAAVSYGTIVGTRPVTVRGGGGGLGTVAGAVAGGVAGSFVGGDPRSNVLGGLGGALLGGLAGNALGSGASSGQAVEFTVREDTGGDFQVVQTNEDGLQAGDRVVISRGDRTRLARAAGGPPPSAAYQPPGYPRPGYAPSGQGSAEFPQAGYPQPGYNQPAYAQPGYGQPIYEVPAQASPYAGAPYPGGALR
jgi:outer membrane lipoprotein SlyB